MEKITFGMGTYWFSREWGWRSWRKLRNNGSAARRRWNRDVSAFHCLSPSERGDFTRGVTAAHINWPQQCIINCQPSSVLQIFGVAVKGRGVQNNLLTVARGDDGIACIAIRLTHLFDLRIFLLRLSAQIAKIVLQRLDELLSLFRPRRATPHEWHLPRLSRFIGSNDDLQVYSLKCDVTDHHFTKFSYFALFCATSERKRLNFTTHALGTDLSSA